MISFDGVSVTAELGVDISTDMLTGVIRQAETVLLGEDGKLVKEVIAVVIRSAAFTSFRFPVTTFSVASTKQENFGGTLKRVVHHIATVVSKVGVKVKSAGSSRKGKRHVGRLRLITADGHKSHKEPLDYLREKLNLLIASDPAHKLKVVYDMCGPMYFVWATVLILCIFLSIPSSLVESLDFHCGNLRTGALLCPSEES